MCRYWNSVWHRYGFVLNVSAIKFNWKITFQWVFKWCVVSVNHNTKWVFEPFQLIDRLTRPLFLTVQVWNAFVDLITIQSNPKNQIKTRQTHCIDLTISIGHLMNTHNILSAVRRSEFDWSFNDQNSIKFRTSNTKCVIYKLNQFDDLNI